MPKRNWGPWVVALTLVAFVGLASVVYWPNRTPGIDEGLDFSRSIPYEGDAADAPSVPAPDVALGRCGTVTYTPPTASEAHRADLCRPAGAPRGAVILVHGGGGYSGDRSTTREWADWYRAQGFVTLSIDYTLLGDGSPEPVYPRPEQDMKAAIQWARIQAEPLGYDPQRILLHGSSAGARLAAQAFVTPGDSWFQGPDVWPDVADDAAGLIGFYGYYDGDTLEAERYYGGLPDTGDRPATRRWVHADSVSQAVNATGPVLLFHGDVDGLISIAQTERFGAALAGSGVDVTTFIVTDGDHAFDGRLGDLTTDTGADAAAEVATWLDERFPA